MIVTRDVSIFSFSNAPSCCLSDWRLLISHLITAHHTVSLSSPLIGCWRPVLPSDWPTGIAGVKFINRETPDWCSWLCRVSRCEEIRGSRAGHLIHVGLPESGHGHYNQRIKIRTQETILQLNTINVPRGPSTIQRPEEWHYGRNKASELRAMTNRLGGQSRAILSLWLANSGSL